MKHKEIEYDYKNGEYYFKTKDFYRYFYSELSCNNSYKEFCKEFNINTKYLTTKQGAEICQKIMDKIQKILDSYVE